MISNSLVAHFFFGGEMSSSVSGSEGELGFTSSCDGFEGELDGFTSSCDGFEGELRFTSGFEGELEFF